MNRGPQVLLNRLGPAAALTLVMALLSFLIPTSDTLWFKLLGISARITTRQAEGCTPGFWRQEHHFDSWPDPYEPDTAFESVFGRDVPDDPTLHEALELPGGGLHALMRHTVAALLNGAHPDVDYAFSVDQVIAKFQAAFDRGEFEATKDEFEAANEGICPLDGGDEGHSDPEESELREVGDSTATPTPSSTATIEDEGTSTPTHTSSPTPTETPRAKPSSAPSSTSVPTNTPGSETSPTATATGTPSPTPNDDPSPSATVQATATPSPEPSPTATLPPPTETEDSPTPEG